MEGYLIDNLSVERIIGNKNIDEIIVINRLMKSKIPIDEVPWWLETARVLKEQIVVIALKKMAEGVLLSTTKSILWSSIYLLK